MSRMRLQRHPDAASLIATLAADLAQPVRAAAAAGREAWLALAGGRTAPPLLRTLAQGLPAGTRLRAVASDERWVDAGHPDRNEDALKACFAGSGLEVEWISLVPQSVSGAADAAYANARLAPWPQPFDACLLGMGPDGHFASLFPGAPNLQQALAPDCPQPAIAIAPDPLPAAGPWPRVSLSLARLLASRRLRLAISGGDKLALVERVLAAPATSPLIWPVAALLSSPHPDAEVHWSP